MRNIVAAALLFFTLFLLPTGCVKEEEVRVEEPVDYVFDKGLSAAEHLEKLEGFPDEILDRHFDEVLLRGRVDGSLPSSKVLLEDMGYRLGEEAMAYLSFDVAFHEIETEEGDLLSKVDLLLEWEKRESLWAETFYHQLSKNRVESLAFDLFHGKGDHQPFQPVTGVMLPGYKALFQEIQHNAPGSLWSQWIDTYLFGVEQAGGKYSEGVDRQLRALYQLGVAFPWRLDEHLRTTQTRYVRYPLFEGEDAQVLNNWILDRYGRVNRQDPLVFNYQITHSSQKTLGLLFISNYQEDSGDYRYEKKGLLWSLEEGAPLALEDLFVQEAMEAVDGLVKSKTIKRVSIKDLDSFTLGREGLQLFFPSEDLILETEEIIDFLNLELLYQ